ncbi:Protein MEI2-like [Actinidia chinensis var. chinensis]|uniref:Protein MEI2-like n=1 Tax=Actinidia chinensis var. chinensis TaxID=1590841 RepID=A0A2R6QLU6_ACTCC|nr:Protein MEI2-like [Actinidia chinensis var. chinensis]
MADGNGYWRSSMGDGDLQEEVWCGVRERQKDSRAKVEKDRVSDGSSPSSWHLPGGIIPSGRSVNHEASKMAQQSSAPVNIPDWSKIYGKSSNEGLMNPYHDDDDDDDHDNGDHGRDDVEMVPPHEYIAKKLARSQISSFSMCEGIGRTLKGRDLSKVRNAILTKTGFLE